jgi:hypothetical protein
VVALSRHLGQLTEAYVHSSKWSRMAMRVITAAVGAIALVLIVGPIPAYASDWGDLGYALLKDLSHADEIRVDLPRVTAVPFTSASHPDYLDAPLGSDIRSVQDGAAETAGLDMQHTAEEAGAGAATDDPSVREQVIHGVRDCAKDGVEKTAWDLWWTDTFGGSFAINLELRDAISDCLQKQGVAQPVADSLAQQFVADLDRGIDKLPPSITQDFAAFSNWLRVSDYYYVPN